ncbi:MAG: rhodanese-like domain-containing protein [Flavobacteriales bacterium]|nr:rhodanese-like domain-containing protein [Flavobacteriales bacterium]
MENLDQEEWQQGSDAKDAVIIDVRSAEECEEGIVKGAQILDIYRADEFMKALESLDKSKEYYLYCRSGNRSGQACMIMESRGFTKTYNLSGGILEWEEELVEPQKT